MQNLLNAMLAQDAVSMAGFSLQPVDSDLPAVRGEPAVLAKTYYDNPGQYTLYCTNPVTLQEERSKIFELPRITDYDSFVTRIEEIKTAPATIAEYGPLANDDTFIMHFIHTVVRDITP